MSLRGVLVAVLAVGLTAACSSAAVDAGPPAASSTTGSVAAVPGTRATDAPTPTKNAPTTNSPAPVAAGGLGTTAAPTRSPGPCAGNTAKQLVRVRLSVQHLWMCERSVLVYSTPITSGMLGQYTHTPTGTFTVQGRVRNTTLTLLSGRTYDVKYWIPFQGPLFGFHDSSWQDFAYGSAKYKTDGSHGCVHMPLGAIAFLYTWAHVGAKVRITTA